MIRGVKGYMRIFQLRYVRVVMGIALCLVVFAPSATHAATDDESMTVSPISRHYQFDAGQATQDELTVINNGSVGYDVIVYARPYSVTSDSYEPNFVNTPHNADAYQWVQFATTKYHIDAGQTVHVPYTLHVPATSAPGGHYGVVFVETQPSDSGSVVRRKRVGMVIYATVKGQYSTHGEAAGSTIPFWQFSPPLTAAVSTKNTGNSDFDDTATYTVKNVLGKVIYSGSNTYTVLPGTTRKISLGWSSAPWFGIYSVEVQHSFLGQSPVAKGYVLMVPRWLYVVIALVIIGAAVYAIRRRR
jgi:hypothetical protein